MALERRPGLAADGRLLQQAARARIAGWACRWRRRSPRRSPGAREPQQMGVEDRSEAAGLAGPLLAAEDAQLATPPPAPGREVVGGIRARIIAAAGPRAAKRRAPGVEAVRSWPILRLPKSRFDARIDHLAPAARHAEAAIRLLAAPPGTSRARPRAPGSAAHGPGRVGGCHTSWTGRTRDRPRNRSRPCRHPVHIGAGAFRYALGPCGRRPPALYLGRGLAQAALASLEPRS